MNAGQRLFGFLCIAALIGMLIVWFNAQKPLTSSQTPATPQTNQIIISD